MVLAGTSSLSPTMGIVCGFGGYELAFERRASLSLSREREMHGNFLMARDFYLKNPTPRWHGILFKRETEHLCLRQLIHLGIPRNPRM